MRILILFEYRINSRQFSHIYSPQMDRIKNIHHDKIFPMNKKDTPYDRKQLKILENFRDVIDKIDDKFTSLPNVKVKREFSQNCLN